MNILDIHIISFIITVCGQYILDIVVYVKRNIHTFTSNNQIHSRNTRNASRLATVPRRLALATKNPLVIGPDLYEHLPENIKGIDSVSGFQAQVKSILCDNTFYKVDEYMKHNF